MSEQDFEVRRVFWFACVDIDVLEDDRLTPIEKVVFCLLCRYVNQCDRECFPSIKTLAEKANCAESSARNAIKKLIALGLIERQERYINGRQTTSLYTIIGYNAPYYNKKQENNGTEGGCNTCTPPFTSYTHEGVNDDTQKYNQNKYNITLTRENLPNSTDLEKNSETEAESQEQKKLNPVIEEKKPEKTIKAENPEEHFDPKAAPSIMQPTARYLLQRTGRKYLTRDEISALRELSVSQVPARVQKEIDRAYDRFVNQKRDLKTLRFEYIASALQHQPSFGKKKKSKAEAEKLKQECRELMPKELKPMTENEMNAMLARIEELQNQTRGDNQA